MLLPFPKVVDSEEMINLNLKGGVSFIASIIVKTKNN